MAMRGTRLTTWAEADQEALLVEVRIEEPAGPYHTYSYDSRHHALRLSETVIDVTSTPAEIGVLTRTEGSETPGLKALALTDMPTFPGCFITMRVLGGAMIDDKAGSLLVVGVPASHPRYAAVQTVTDLSQRELEALSAFIRRRFGVKAEQWLMVEAVQQRIQTAIELAVHERIMRAQVRYGAAWRAEAPPREGSSEAEPYTWAEHLLPTLPLRFQHYVAELLYPDERILFFTERPPFSHGRRFLRGKQEREGLLIITDRSVLLMMDPIPPGATMVHWGYIAKITAVERIVGARVQEQSGRVSLELDAEASGGVETIRVPFPPAYRQALEEGAALLRRFIPAKETQAVRRVYLPVDPRRNQAEPEGMGDLTVTATTAKGDQQAVHLTPPHLIVHSERDAWEGCVSAVSSLEVVQSLLGCRLSFTIPMAEGERQVTLRYNYPQSPPFLDVVSVIRHLLGQPLERTKLRGSAL